MSKYDVVEYWNKRKDPCSNNIEKFTKMNKDYVQKHITDCKVILDFGPGYGRLFSSYINVNKVVGVDVTEQHKEKLMIEAKKQGFEFDLICNDGNSNLNFKDDQFDAVVSSQVFLHQPPHIIENIMKELIRIGKKVIVISYMNEKERYEQVGVKVVDHRYCFNYDYRRICEKNKWIIEDENKYNNQFMFVYKKR